MRIYRRYKHRPEWHIDFRYRDESGRMRRHIEVVGSKKLAEQVLHKRMAEVAEGKFFPDREKRKERANITFRDFAAEYWDLHWKRLKGKGKQSTLKFLLQAFGDRRLEYITVACLQRFYNKKMEETTAATANRYMARLANMFELAKKWGKFAGENPAKEVQLEAEADGRDRWLAKEEIERLLGACSSRLYPVLVCALHTGMRRGQILGLRWESVDLDRSVLHGPRAKKGQAPKIPITPQLGEVLLALGPKKSGPVFHMPVIILRRHFSKALKEAKIVDFRFHDLRRTFGSHFIMRTNDLPALQKILGHATPRMTQKYAHLSKGHLASEMQIFAAAMPMPKPNGNGRVLEAIATRPSLRPTEIA